MKAQIGRGKGQKGLLGYVFQGHKNGGIDKGAIMVGGTCSGSTLEEIQAEFAALRKIRPNIERPAWHCSLSLKPPERLTNEQWAQVASMYMEGMGFTDKHLWVAVRHSDTEHDHIHIAASRIGLDGKIYLGQKEAVRSMPLTNEIAREFGLSELAFDARAEVKGITSGEKGRMDRTDEIPTRVMLQAYIDHSAKDRPTFPEFISRLEAQGVKIIPSGKTGQAQGMTFELSGVPFTGTKLGDRFKWKPLQARLDYQPERDQHVLDRLRAQAARSETIGELTNPNLTINRPAAGTKGRSRTLDIAFEQAENGIYKWKSRDTVAIMDHGDIIAVHSKAESAVRASLQLCKDKGWKSVKATGSEEFKRQTWLIASEMNLVVQDYQPSAEDLEELKQRLAAKEAKYGKNNGNTEAGREQSSRNEGRSRAGLAGREHSYEFQLDRRRPGSEDRSGAESDGGARQQDRMAVQVQATGSAGPNHSRGPDLAHDGGITRNWRNIGSVADVAGTLSDLAAPISEARSDKSAIGLEQSPTPEHAAKIAAWERQSLALGAEKYRITLKPRAEKARNGRKLFDQNYGNVGKKSDREAAGVAEKFWTKDEIKTEIAKLRAKNSQGYDVYLTPISDSRHFIVVDDLTPASYADMKKAGIRPSIVQNSSENNKQAIIIIDKESGADEQKLANQIVTRLNKKWGDPSFSGVVHPFRLAGFSNKKTGKNNFITTLELSTHRRCDVTSVLMQKLRDDEKMKKQEADGLKIKEEADKEYNSRMSKIDSPRQMTEDVV